MRPRKVDNTYMDPRTEKMLAERAEAAKVAPTPAPQRRSPKTKTKLLAVAGAAVFFVAYHLIVTLPAHRADRLEMEARAAQSLKTNTAARQDSVSECLTKAKDEADAQWTTACKARRQGPNCPLPERQATAFEQAERESRNACLLGR